MEEKQSHFRKWIIRVVIFTTLSLFLLAAGLVYWFYTYTETAPLVTGKPEKILVEVKEGATFRDVQTQLGEKGLINDDIRFTILARYLKLAHKLKAGEFRLTQGQKPEALLKELVNAKPVLYSVTIPEGLNLKEVARIFADKDWCSYDEFIKLATDKEFIKKLGFDKIDSLEGYLFPDTYLVTRSYRNAEYALKLMTRKFKKVWQAAVKDVPKLTLDQHQLITLASIVEKEAVKPSEQPVIAGVFYNRLAKNMRLQSDPTVRYGVENRSGPITRSDLRRKTPYNTYVITGLPPGPICNPGEGAIRAAVKPAETEYFYFVSNNDGSHQFSKNLAEHNRAVKKYRKAVRETKRAAQKGVTSN